MEKPILTYNLRGKRIEVIKKNGAYYVKDDVNTTPCISQGAAIILFYNKIETNNNIGGKHDVKN